MNKMSKRGNIPITILVLGVLLVCGLAIFSFYSAKDAFNKGFSDISVIEEVKLEKEKMDFYRDSLGFDESQINDLFNIGYSDKSGNYLGKNKGGLNVTYYLP